MKILRKTLIVLSLSLPLLIGGYILLKPEISQGEKERDCLAIPKTPLKEDTRFWGKELIQEQKKKGLPPQFKTSQEGKKELVPLTEEEIKNPEKLKRALEWMLGGKFQDTCAPLNPKLKLDPGLTEDQMKVAHITKTEQGFFAKPVWEDLGFVKPTKPAEEHIQIYGFEFDGLLGEKSYGYLMVPRSDYTGPRELVIARHQTLAACASREQIGACTEGEGIAPAYALGVEFARRGYIVLAGPDMPGYGKMREYPGGNDTSLEYDTVAMHKIRQYFPDMSVLLAEQIRTRRGINAILALQKEGNFTISNPKKLIVSGHSKGAYSSLMYGVLDPDVATIVSNAGPLSYPWRADDLGVEEADGNYGLTGFIGRWCGWGYLPRVCQFKDTASIPLDSPGLVRIAMSKGKKIFLNVIEDDYLPYNEKWKEIQKVGEENVRVAKKVGAQVKYEIVQSGYRDKAAIKKCALVSKMPADKATLKKVRYCQASSGFAYPHGIYFGPMNRVFSDLEKKTFVAGGTVKRSEGAP